jgi:glucuronoarabinoxylan endo-1,4-beta-xylanase
MSDPSAVDYVGINAWHDYDGAASVINPYAFQNKLYWETEVSAGVGFGPSLCGGCWDPSMADALLWAQIVDNRMAVANANAWNWWFLVGHTNDNEGLVGSDHVTVSKRAYMLGNYSRFVRPGFFRIDATHAPQLGILTSAYKDPSTGTLVIVVINQNSLYVSQSFLLTGAAASSVTPWITSTDLNLAQQPDVPVVGGSFTYNLPGSSIVSFVGSATASIAPPSGLTAAVQ